MRVLESAGGPLWRRVASIAARLVPFRTGWQALAAGALWALMPCGLLYAALATSASAYSAIDGAATMAAFAAGTLPAMLGVGALAAPIAALLQRSWLRRAAGGLVLAFGIWSTAGLAAQAGIFSLGATCSHVAAE
jgi:hypothetical protein